MNFMSTKSTYSIYWLSIHKQSCPHLKKSLKLTVHIGIDSFWAKPSMPNLTMNYCF